LQGKECILVVMKKSIAILAAVSEEISGIKKAMTIVDRTRLDKTEIWTGAWRGNNIILVRTGVGRKKAKQALSAELKVGDLFIADHILNAQNNSVSFEMGDTLNSEWLDLAKSISLSGEIKIKVGKLITVNSVIHTQRAKQDLGKQFSADAVEMETIEIALLAHKNKIPFISVRGISDAVDHELIDSSSFLGRDGEISKLRAGWYVLTHPKSLKNAISLRSQTQLATQNLTNFISKLISI
jgi:adenosylhomocysteine nucleosidase